MFLTNIWTALFEKETWKAKPTLQISGFPSVSWAQMSSNNLVKLLNLRQHYLKHEGNFLQEIFFRQRCSIFGLKKQSCVRRDSWPFSWHVSITQTHLRDSTPRLASLCLWTTQSQMQVESPPCPLFFYMIFFSTRLNSFFLTRPHFSRHVPRAEGIGQQVFTFYGSWSVISPISKLNRVSSSLRLFFHVPLKRDQFDWNWRISLNDTPNAIGCTAVKVFWSQSRGSLLIGRVEWD